MGVNFKKIALYAVIPLIIAILLFNYNIILGVVFIFAFVFFIMFTRRAGIFSFIGTLSYSRGNLAQAILWFDMAYKTGKAKPKTIVSYAYLLLKSGDIAKSEKLLNEILGTKLETDERMYAKSNLALVLWKKGELESAISTLEEVFENYKTTAVYGSLGYLLILKGDLDRALKFNLEAYDYNNKSPIILDNLGQTYYLRGELEKSIEIYEELLKMNPSFPEAYYNYGLVLLKKGERQNALHAMEKAINCSFSFLSTVSREEIESKILEIKNAEGKEAMT